MIEVASVIEICDQDKTCLRIVPVNLRSPDPESTYSRSLLVQRDRQAESDRSCQS